MAKSIDEIILMDGLKYSKEHEWTRTEDSNVRIGVTDYAQDQLGEIVFVELPEEGDEFVKDEVFGTLESTKAVSELYMPIGGKVLEVNRALPDQPELVNQDPYDKGWMIVIEPSDKAELDALMDQTAYLDLLKGS